IFIAANISFFQLHLSGNTLGTSVEVLGLRSSENDTKSNSDIRFMNQLSYQGSQWNKSVKVSSDLTVHSHRFYLLLGDP
ncbi:hypothetical protein PGIGA_G00080320, partial [Pangasianodon gigas]|nr:hypothetical protein [Pangasianodon gigas]